MNDAACVETALSLARPGEAVEIFLENSVSSSVTVVDGEPEATEERRDHGAGVRLFQDGRVGFAYTAALSPEGLAAAVDSARALSAHGRREEQNRPPAGGPATATPAAGAGPRAPEADLASRLEAARRLEAAARELSPDAIRTRAALVTDAAGTVKVAHSAGLAASWSWSRAWCSLEVVAQKGDVRQTGFETDWALSSRLLDPERIGQAAAHRALDKFGARRPRTARTSLLLAPLVTAGLFEALAEALSAKAVLRHRSLFAGRRGDRIGSDSVTLTDDGRRPDGFATAPFDGEGVPSAEAVLMRSGVLVGFLHDTYTAAHMQTSSTGHAVRDGYTALPAVGTRNLCLAPSGPTRQEIVAGVGEGILVEEVMGLHTVDPVTGDFSLGAVGRGISRGTPGRPLENFAISGNILEILESVEAVASDLRFFPGGAGGSTVLLGGITVSGE